MRNAIFAVLVFMTSLSYASPGFGPGNGGDGILIQDEIVMRDFVNKASFQTIEDNEKFLSSVPDFKKLIWDISAGNSVLALAILTDLLQTTIYLADDELRLLPAGQTSVNGPGADVQLAVRYQDSIILSPRFGSIKNQAYLLVHEALHGLLDDAEGPLHHTRVRTIVKYLKDHRGSYDAAALEIFLEKNGFSIGGSRGNVFDVSLDSNLRCAAFADFYSDIRAQTGKFLNISCDPSITKASVYIEKYIVKKMNIPGWNEMLADSFTHNTSEELYVAKEVYPNSIPEYMLNKIDKWACNSNKTDLSEVKKENKKHKMFLAMTNKVTEVLWSLDTSKAERAVILNFFQNIYYGNDGSLKETLKSFDSLKASYSRLVNRTQESIQVGQEIEKRCAKAGF